MKASQQISLFLLDSSVVMIWLHKMIALQKMYLDSREPINPMKPRWDLWKTWNRIMVCGKLTLDFLEHFWPKYLKLLFIISWKCVRKLCRIWRVFQKKHQTFNCMFLEVLKFNARFRHQIKGKTLKFHNKNLADERLWKYFQAEQKQNGTTLVVWIHSIP